MCIRDRLGGTYKTAANPDILLCRCISHAIGVHCVVDAPVLRQRSIWTWNKHCPRIGARATWTTSTLRKKQPHTIRHNGGHDCGNVGRAQTSVFSQNNQRGALLISNLSLFSPRKQLHRFPDDLYMPHLSQQAPSQRAINKYQVAASISTNLNSFHYCRI